ncbi:MAG: hypothetical protein KDC80_09240 [Saprospiraceae bacterium]|nr:hypothetical protein [Saprospiraceae bacterium]
MKWRLIRTVGFYLVGLMNTLLIRDKDIGTFKNYLGYVLIIVAIFDTYRIIRAARLEKRKEASRN